MVCAGYRWGLGAALLLGACEGDDGTPPQPPQCVEYSTEGCNPQFPPQYERLHSEVLLPVCGVQGGACHGTAQAEGALGGLVIDADLDVTYATLLGDDGGAAFVTPGDVACSSLAARANTTDQAFVMPPGAVPLDDGVRCSLAQWITSGAPR